MPGVDWRLLKAQLWQESRFKSNAVSPVGAGGIAQFMPGSWEFISAKMGLSGSRFDDKLAIPAAAFYMADLRRNWSWNRPEIDRHSLALASYNAGLGNLLSAQRACNDAVLYAQIVRCLPDVTGHHSKETKDYVVKIYGFYQQMVFL